MYLQSYTTINLRDKTIFLPQVMNNITGNHRIHSFKLSFKGGGGVMSLRVPTSLRLWTICVSRDMTSGTRRDAQGRSSKKGGKMISTTH